MKAEIIDWETVLLEEEQAGDCYARLATPFQNLASATRLEKLMSFVGKAPDYKKPAEMVLEQATRAKVRQKIVVYLSNAIEDAAANGEQIERLADQLEMHAHDIAGDLDEYFVTVTELVDALLFHERVVVLPRKQKEEPILPPAHALMAAFENRSTKTDKNEVLETLRGYMQPLHSLLLEVTARLHELEQCTRAWTGEEKELPNVHKHITSVYRLLLSSLGHGTPEEPCIDNIDTLLSIQKQIEAWLALRKCFPIPSNPKPLPAASEACSFRARNKDILPRPSAMCADSAAATLPAFLRNGNNTTRRSPSPPSYNGERSPPVLPSLFGNSGYPAASHEGDMDWMLPPFNPQKDLPRHGSQPLLPTPSSARASWARRRGRGPMEVDYAEEQGGILSMKRGDDSQNGSLDDGLPLAMDEDMRLGKRGRTVHNRDEHAFILSKLAALASEADHALKGRPVSPPKKVLSPNRRRKRPRSEKYRKSSSSGEDEEDEYVPHVTTNLGTSPKRMRTRLDDFEMQTLRAGGEPRRVGGRW